MRNRFDHAEKHDDSAQRGSTLLSRRHPNNGSTLTKGKLVPRGWPRPKDDPPLDLSKPVQWVPQETRELVDKLISDPSTFHEIARRSTTGSAFDGHDDSISRPVRKPLLVDGEWRFDHRDPNLYLEVVTRERGDESFARIIVDTASSELHMTYGAGSLFPVTKPADPRTSLYELEKLEGWRAAQEFANAATQKFGRLFHAKLHFRFAWLRVRLEDHRGG